MGVPELHNLVGTLNPAVVFLMETEMSKAKAEQLRWQLGFPHGFSVKSEGRSSGLALFWKQQIDVDLQNFSKSHIDVLIKS